MTTTKEPWVIDGRRGEGGGQVLRTSLALSILCRRGLVIDNIRGGRKNPGLLAQHLCATNAAARICNGHVEGARLSSNKISFTPNEIQAGKYAFNIATAGSASLVLQTLLYPLLAANAESEVVVQGGTHNLAAPPVPFLAQSFAPLLERQGSHLDTELIRAGFYPKGGGEVLARVSGGLPKIPLDLDKRGKHVGTHAVISIANLPPRIAREEADTLQGVLKLRPNQISIEERTESKGPGNAVFVVVEHENVCEVFTGFAQRGVRAKDVAERVAKVAKRYLASNFAVGEHLADQLILPLVFGGGSFTTSSLSKHVTTQIELVKELVGVDIEVHDLEASASGGKSGDVKRKGRHPDKSASKKAVRVVVDNPISFEDLRQVD